MYNKWIGVQVNHTNCQNFGNGNMENLLLRKKLSKQTLKVNS